MQTRRQLMKLAAAGIAAPALAQRRADVPKPLPLDLSQFEPRSTLHVPATALKRSLFPLIDFHTHLSWGDPAGQTNSLILPAQDLLRVMDAKNIGVMVNLTGGFGKSLEISVRDLSRAHPDRFVVFTQPWFGKVSEPGYAAWQAEELRRAHAAGARGLKVLKSLGLVVRDQGKLVPVDDPRFDPMWETAAALHMPVAIHTSDPEAFFTPIDRFNERFEELNAHPDWSFHGKDYPTDRQLQEARFRVLARHPKTTFVVLHVGNSENLDYIAAAMLKYPNMHVEFGARIGELGRQPRASRKFFDRFQDRILFGTDAVPNGFQYPQQVFGEQLYEIYFRFLETADEYFDYAPAKVPPQGRWRIYGIALPGPLLKKVYWNNAARLLGRKLI